TLAAILVAVLCLAPSWLTFSCPVPIETTPIQPTGASASLDSTPPNHSAGLDDLVTMAVLSEDEPAEPFSSDSRAAPVAETSAAALLAAEAGALVWERMIGWLRLAYVVGVLLLVTRWL